MRANSARSSRHSSRSATAQWTTYYSISADIRSNIDSGVDAVGWHTAPREHLVLREQGGNGCRQPKEPTIGCKAVQRGSRRALRSTEEAGCGRTWRHRVQESRRRCQLLHARRTCEGCKCLQAQAQMTSYLGTLRADLLLGCCAHKRRDPS